MSSILFTYSIYHLLFIKLEKTIMIVEKQNLQIETVFIYSYSNHPYFVCFNIKLEDLQEEFGFNNLV